MMDAAEFVAKVLQRFPPFHWEDRREAGWMQDAIQELSVFEGKCDGKVLERAMRDLIRTRKKPGIPAIADLITACAEAKRWLEAEKERDQLPLEPTAKTPEWSPDRVKLAYDLCRTELGKRACREGWSWRLWHHCRIEMKHPPAALCDQWQREAREHAQLVEELYRKAAAFTPKPPVAGGGFVKLGDIGLDVVWAKAGQGMIDREKRKAAEILEGWR